MKDGIKVKNDGWNLISCDYHDLCTYACDVINSSINNNMYVIKFIHYRNYGLYNYIVAV